MKIRIHFLLDNEYGFLFEPKKLSIVMLRKGTNYAAPRKIDKNSEKSLYIIDIKVNLTCVRYDDKIILDMYDNTVISV